MDNGSVVGRDADNTEVVDDADIGNVSTDSNAIAAEVAGWEEDPGYVDKEAGKEALSKGKFVEGDEEDVSMGKVAEEPSLMGSAFAGQPRAISHKNQNAK